MHRILKAEMVRVNISVKNLSMKLGITERSLRNKINGVTDFTLTEALKISSIISPNMPLDELFKKETEVA